MRCGRGGEDEVYKCCGNGADTAVEEM